MSLQFRINHIQLVSHRSFLCSSFKTCHPSFLSSILWNTLSVELPVLYYFFSQQKNVYTYYLKWCEPRSAKSHYYPNSCQHYHLFIFPLLGPVQVNLRRKQTRNTNTEEEIGSLFKLSNSRKTLTMCLPFFYWFTLANFR